MKKLEIHFEQDPSMEVISVLVRAAKRDEEVEALIERIGGKKPKLLTVADMDGNLRRINEDSIVSISVSGKQVQVVTERECYTMQQSLQSLEGELDEGKFVRISRYELVNLNKVWKYDFTLSGTLRLELAGGIETWASRRCIPKIRKRLSEV